MSGPRAVRVCRTPGPCRSVLVNMRAPPSRPCVSCMTAGRTNPWRVAGIEVIGVALAGALPKALAADALLSVLEAASAPGAAWPLHEAPAQVRGRLEAESPATRRGAPVVPLENDGGLAEAALGTKGAVGARDDTASPSGRGVDVGDGVAIGAVAKEFCDSVGGALPQVPFRTMARISAGVRNGPVGAIETLEALPLLFKLSPAEQAEPSLPLIEA
jgi:hypothetical protein